ncbi:zinc-binding metallopeptidase family protein [Shinella pollutisoli]|uniref:Zinc-binding metallopeptidase n=1 Tax=Shinella pollutisoli TaxID=2250594 RepID=A0ABV7DBX3_9HYPH|nr:putative zinc-binding metallopeptidase [Shinella pollutisoli]
MKLFTCRTCGQTVHFDNRLCVRCGAMLGFVAGDVTLHALVPAGEGLWALAPGGGGALYRFCDNALHGVCNWLVPADGPHAFCEACRHNRIVPVTDPRGLERWRRIGLAQRHLFYSLLRWNLPRPTREEDPEGGLVFDFLADELDENGNVVSAAMTGHEAGLISLRAAEADDEVRESVRVSMNEPYRSLLGHFRHEIGHFYWQRLVRDEATLEEARRLFGDERADYAAALRRNYDEGPPADWQQHFISTYASSHPAEDFAECWAHFFHIVDTLETARAFGLVTDPKGHAELEAEVTFDPYRAPDAARLVEAWIPLSVALNAIQRSMGQPDSYPFVLPPPVVEKLDFINRLVHESAE